MEKEKSACSGCTSSSCSAQAPRPDENLEEFMERQEIASRMCKIKHKVLVLSGKGGVGKSTVAVNTAVALTQKGFNVGLLDVDIHGPSIPTLLNIDKPQMFQNEEGLVPVNAGCRLKVMSVGFMLEDPDQALIWRGPMKMGIIKQFIKDVVWGELDYLIIDCPPGTGDEPLSVCQLIEDLDGGIVVTTPQKLAAVDVRKSITFCNKIGLPVIGVVENMSGFKCGECGKVTEIFSKHGGKVLAEDMGVPFLGAIPVDPDIASAGDDGKPYMQHFNESDTGKLFEKVIEPVVNMKENEKRSKENENCNSCCSR